MEVISSERVPIKCWIPLDKIEENALVQLKNCANLPFTYKHIAVMPDCHSGYGVTIGSVLVTKGVVVPNAVGVDIGCGMCTVKTSIKVEDLPVEKLKEIMGKIREVIPLGFDHHKEAQDESLMPTIKTGMGEYYVSQFEHHPASEEFNKRYPVISREYKSALKQLATLGSGNHFLELQKDSENFIWIMIHSGSRNLGYKVAKYHNEVAYDLNKKWYSNTVLPKNKEDSLAFLPIETEEAKTYMREMEYCLEFAKANRMLMMERIADSFREVIPNFSIQAGTVKFNKEGIEVTDDIINIHHNYATWENHFGENVIVHRKGATLARQDTIGIIPGSQGTSSYIVKGKGNPQSFDSCSHGAGRTMGRKDAIRRLDLAAEQKLLNDKGIIHSIRNQEDLEEATSAYKNIDEVMKNQEDLVEILHKLEPLAVIKG